MAYSKRLEVKTVDRMIRMYCRKEHGTGGGGLCSGCGDLLSYAGQRIERCVYGDAKPVCSRCSTHCYRPEMRKAIRRVMRYAGPRMIWRSPLLAIRHLYRELFKSGGEKRVGKPKVPR